MDMPEAATENKSNNSHLSAGDFHASLIMTPQKPAFRAIFTTAENIILKNSMIGLLVRIVVSQIA